MKHKIAAIWFFLLVFTVPVLALTEEDITCKPELS
jgi:hypothetical protein